MAFPIQMAGTLLSAVSSIGEARARAEEARFNRYQKQLEARQTNQRLRELNSAESTNMAFMAFLNRDPNDRSLKAFMDRQKDIAYKDANEIQSMGMLKASQQILSANMEATKAKNAMQAGYLGAASSIVSGLYRYQQVKV
jgi:hypothetical protein